MFTEVINRQGLRLLEIARTVETKIVNPIDAPKESGRLMFDFVLRPDMISLYRILVAEVGRFPTLGEFVLENCLGPFRDLMTRLISAASAAGQIRCDDQALLHALLTGLLTGWPTQQILLGRTIFETPEKREAYFEAAWILFLRGAS